MKPGWEMFVALMRLLWPPIINQEPVMLHWQRAVAVVSMTTLTSTILGAALAIGLIPTFFHGFARADAVSSAVAPLTAQLLALQRGQNEEKIQALDHDLLETRTKQCQAIRDNNLAVKAFAEARFASGWQAYLNLAGHAWRIPDCSELI